MRGCVRTTDERWDLFHLIVRCDSTAGCNLLRLVWLVYLLASSTASLPACQPTGIPVAIQRFRSQQRKRPEHYTYMVLAPTMVHCLLSCVTTRTWILGGVLMESGTADMIDNEKESQKEEETKNSPHRFHQSSQPIDRFSPSRLDAQMRHRRQTNPRPVLFHGASLAPRYHKRSSTFTRDTSLPTHVGFSTCQPCQPIPACELMSRSQQPGSLRGRVLVSICNGTAWLACTARRPINRATSCLVEQVVSARWASPQAFECRLALSCQPSLSLPV